MTNPQQPKVIKSDDDSPNELAPKSVLNAPEIVDTTDEESP